MNLREMGKSIICDRCKEYKFARINVKTQIICLDCYDRSEGYAEFRKKGDRALDQAWERSNESTEVHTVYVKLVYPDGDERVIPFRHSKR